MRVLGEPGHSYQKHTPGELGGPLVADTVKKIAWSGFQLIFGNPVCPITCRKGSRCDLQSA